MVDNCLTLREGEEGAATLSFRHRFGDELAFKAEYHIGGTENVRLVVVYLRVLEERAAMMTVDGGGRIVYANRKFCSILGCKVCIFCRRCFRVECTVHFSSAIHYYDITTRTPLSFTQK